MKMVTDICKIEKTQNYCKNSWKIMREIYEI